MKHAETETTQVGTVPVAPSEMVPAEDAVAGALLPEAMPPPSAMSPPGKMGVAQAAMGAAGAPLRAGQ